MAVARGVFISIVALLYVLFAIGVFLGKSWAWWPCITAVIINLFLVVGVLVQGRAPHRGNRLVGNSSGVACLLLLTKKRRCGRRLT